MRSFPHEITHSSAWDRTSWPTFNFRTPPHEIAQDWRGRVRKIGHHYYCLLFNWFLNDPVALCLKGLTHCLFRASTHFPAPIVSQWSSSGWDWFARDPAYALLRFTPLLLWAELNLNKRAMSIWWPKLVSGCSLPKLVTGWLLWPKRTLSCATQTIAPCAACKKRTIGWREEAGN